MKFQIKKSVMENVLDIANRFVSKTATLPILKNVYIQVKDNKLLARATNMEKYIDINYNLDVDNVVEWSITVDAKMFFDIVKSIQEEDLEISASDETDILTIKTLKDTFTIKWIPASEYVALPEIKSDTNLSIDPFILKTWIQKVLFAILEKNFSPVFTGVYIHTINEEWTNKLSFVGTDSFVLANYKIKLNDEIWDFWVIIPKQSSVDIQYICNMMTDEDWKVSIDVSNNLISLKMKVWDLEIIMTSILIQWNFPDYNNEKIMPKNFNIVITAKSDILDYEIRKVLVVAQDSKKMISIKTQWNRMEISAWKKDSWTWDTWIEIEKQWEDISLYLNWRYINDYIKEADSEYITFNIVNDVAPLILTNDKDPNYKVVVRPLKA